MGTQAQPGTGMQLAETPTAPVVQAETSSSAVAAREKASVEARFLVAMNRPRNPDQARVRLLARCESPAFAEVAEYSKPIGGKKVTGGSIRLMEEIGRQWGNIDVRADVTFDDRERRIVHVSATDLETNYSQSTDVILEKTVERKSPRQGEAVISSRTNSRGEVVYRIDADEDTFFVKQNAAIAKARREMIRAVVPGDLVEEALEEAASTRRHRDATDPAEARKRISDHFYRLGVMPSQVADYLEIPNLEAITPAQIEVLRALYTAMKEGETTWAEIVADKRPSSAPAAKAQVQGKGTSGLKDALRKKAPASASLKAYTVQLKSGATAQMESAASAFAAIEEGRIEVSDEERDRVAAVLDAERED